jgi:hypothetical protein
MDNVFYPGPFAFRMGLRRGKPEDFFRPRPKDKTLINERKKILATNSEQYCVFLPEAEPLLEEFNEQLLAWGVTQTPQTGLELGQSIAPDYLLLKPNQNGMPILLGGCVCFPSSWAFEEKVGRPLDWIHAVVPTLNETLGEKARRFLTQLQPGQAWLRTNWGLTATPNLNQHPALKLPKLTSETDPANVWFRIEHQALIAQPKTGCILFSIRLETCPLLKLKTNPDARNGLLEALQTLPKEIAQYKNLTSAKTNLINFLN